MLPTNMFHDDGHVAFAPVAVLATAAVIAAVVTSYRRSGAAKATMQADPTVAATTFLNQEAGAVAVAVHPPAQDYAEPSPRMHTSVEAADQNAGESNGSRSDALGSIDGSSSSLTLSFLAGFDDDGIDWDMVTTAAKEARLQRESNSNSISNSNSNSTHASPATSHDGHDEYQAPIDTWEADLLPLPDTNTITPPATPPVTPPASPTTSKKEGFKNSKAKPSRSQKKRRAAALKASSMKQNSFAALA